MISLQTCVVGLVLSAVGDTEGKEIFSPSLSFLLLYFIPSIYPTLVEELLDF